MVRKKKIAVLQMKNKLIFNTLYKFSFASSFAKIPTSTRLCQSLRLRIQNTITAFVSKKGLFFKGLSVYYLQQCMQSCQFGALTSLQVQEVSFAVFKEKVIENDSVTKFPFANLFAQNQN
jgi:hypothetical protein